MGYEEHESLWKNTPQAEFAVLVLGWFSVAKVPASGLDSKQIIEVLRGEFDQNS